MDGQSQLLLGVIFSAIGWGFFSYGKKQKAIVPLLTGIGLFVFPYFISQTALLIVIGAVLMVLPYFVRI